MVTMRFVDGIACHGNIGADLRRDIGRWCRALYGSGSGITGLQRGILAPLKATRSVLRQREVEPERGHVNQE
jgi:hypothetical protein